MNTAEKIKYISNWIKNYADQMPSKAQSLVIGISGGIDSSVSSTLSAMTGLKTIVLTMPIKQIENQHDLSLKHQEWLVKNFKNVEAHTISLDKLFETFSSTLNKFDNEHGFANSRARLRMTTLYQVAAANKGIVVGTGNKVEDFGVGFYTKYGDGGVMANDLGFPDIGLTTLQDVSTRSYLISRVTNLPTIVDIDTGFKSCKETIETFEEFGISAVHLEDQIERKKVWAFR